MKLSASQAARAVGKSVPTITRAIKSGKISATRRDGGGFEIDPSELHRVWPPVTDETVSKLNNLGTETPRQSNMLQGEVEALQRQLETLAAERERERCQLSETIDDLRKRLDAESVERRALTAQLTDQREKASQVLRRGFWARLRG